MVKENICDLHGASHINYVQPGQKQHPQKKKHHLKGGKSVRETIRGELRLVGSDIKKTKIHIKQQQPGLDSKFTKPILLSIYRDSFKK